MSEITTIIAKELITLPEFKEEVNRQVEQRLNKISHPAEYLTRDQLATLWKVSRRTVERMTPEALKEHGFTKEKIGVSVRFKSITQ